MQILRKEVRHIRIEILFIETMGRVKEMNKNETRIVKQDRDGYSWIVHGVRHRWVFVKNLNCTNQNSDKNLDNGANRVEEMFCIKHL